MLHDHAHDHHHHHHGADDAAPGSRSGLRMAFRFAVAALVVAAAVLAASLVMVRAGQAIVVTQFGDPVRVLTAPGLAWKLPAPIQGTIPVDLRLWTTSSGLQDVGTRDGLRVLVQAYIAWQVPAEPDRVRQFLRAVRNEPDEAARQLRSFVGSALQVTASSFDLAELVDTDPGRLKLDAFESRLQAQLAAQVLDTYGVAIRQVGLERLSLPATTLAATVGRMRAERETVAEKRTAEGLRVAAEIRSNAARDARITTAKARTDAADIEAQSRQQAAQIFADAYRQDPQLYQLLRSLDTVGSVVGPNTRLILRTDAAPFHVLVDGAPRSGPAVPPVPPSATGSPPK